ncbi:MAG TPA: hypothetical protein VGO93_07985 [Candidatus Xenobia bacterium]|jgi:hypothetical protein
MSQTIDLIRQKFPVTTARVERTIAEAKPVIADAVTTGVAFADATVADGKKLAAAAIENGKKGVQFASDLGKAVEADAKPVAAETVALGKAAYSNAKATAARLAGLAGYHLCHLSHDLKD